MRLNAFCGAVTLCLAASSGLAQEVTTNPDGSTTYTYAPTQEFNDSRNQRTRITETISPTYTNPDTGLLNQTHSWTVEKLNKAGRVKQGKTTSDSITFGIFE